MMPSALKAHGRKPTRTTSNNFANTTSRSHFPISKRTVNARRPAWSAPSKRQQTITQMDPFRSLYHPEVDEDELQYDDDVKDIHRNPPRGSKRRKMGATEPPMRSASTSGAKAIALDTALRSSKVIQFKEEPVQRDRTEYGEDPQESRTMPPPLKTPTSTRQKEIPSSQSPADTPLSSLSRRSMRDVSKSPLKEKSANIATARGSSPRKSVKWAYKKEVADSLENDEACSLVPCSSHISPEKPRKTAEEIYEDLLAQSSPVVKSPKEGIRESPLVKSAEVSHVEESKKLPHPFAPSHTHVRTEILDSDPEEDGKDNDTEDEVDIVKYNIAATSEPHRKTITATPTLDTILSSMPEENAQPTFPPSPSPSRRQPQSINISSSQPTDLFPPSKTTQDLASDQLHHEPSLYTQARGSPLLVTESQYESGWESYYPQGGTESIPPESPPLLRPLSSSPPQTRAAECGTEPMTTVPTQFLPQPASPAKLEPKVPVPPSQATTVDVTQPSPSENSNQCPSSPQALIPSSLPPPPASPVPPMMSSSPCASQKGISQRPGYQWDGRVLTDSQLLPASLMEDSLDLCRPPGGWTYEELEEDEEI